MIKANTVTWKIRKCFRFFFVCVSLFQILHKLEQNYFLIYLNFVQINIPHRKSFCVDFYSCVLLHPTSVVFKALLELDCSLISITEDNLINTLWCVLNLAVSGACQRENEVMQLDKQTDGLSDLAKMMKCTKANICSNCKAFEFLKV